MRASVTHRAPLRPNGMAGHVQQLRPSPALAPYVRHVRVVQQHARSELYQRLPDGELELVIRLGDAPAVHAIGTRLSPLSKQGYEEARAFTVRFRAGGAYPFFGVPLSELTDRVLAVERFWGEDSARLHDTLHTQRDVQSQLAAIEQVLCARLHNDSVYEPSAAGAVRRVLRKLEQTSALPTVAQLAAEAGASTRQLRRSFADVTGLTPKAYLRVLRFQRALRAARLGEGWGSVAQRCGYYDQAHLIAEFRTLAGRTPTMLHG